MEMADRLYAATRDLAGRSPAELYVRFIAWTR